MLGSMSSKWVRALERILPAGWTITRTAPDVVPDGWVSEHAAGLLVEATRGHDTARVWFLPRDWIGIRRPDPARTWPNYWEGILSDDDVTTITVSTEETIPDLLWRSHLSTLSIVNSDWDAAERVWRGRFDQAEAAAERLVAAHCRSPAALDEAAHSLIVLGVPAASVFRRVAAGGSGEGQRFSISALGHFPGDATVAVLAAVLSSPSTSEDARGSAGFAAGRLRAAALGPPLLEAFRLSRDVDARCLLVGGIAELRHAPAGDTLLESMAATEDLCFQATLADTLAILRHRPATAAIRALAEGPVPAAWPGAPEAFDDFVRSKARTALLRLTGDWGAPAEGVRFLLEGPARVEAGEPVVVTLHVENVGDAVQSYFRALEGAIHIDGVARVRRPGPCDGFDSLYPDALWSTPEYLDEWLRAPGPHRVFYERGAGRSNVLTIVVAERCAR